MAEGFREIALVTALMLGATASRGEPTSLEARVDQYLQPYVETGNFSGAVLIGREGQVLFSGAFGLADRENEIDNSPETGFHLASVSRVVTSLAVMMLVDRGLISLDDPISKFWPDWPRGDEITVHHLLTLSAGFPNVNELLGYRMWQHDAQTPKTLVEKFRDLPLDFEPGARSVHSNSNYNALALLIEKVSGMTYGEFLERELFGPLEMNRSTHDGDASRTEAFWAKGYAPVGLADLELVDDIDWSVKTGNGSIVSTVKDLYRLDGAMSGGRLLSRSALDQIFREHFPKNGYGWFLTDASGSAEAYINGRSPGFGSFWGRSLDSGTAVIVLGNLYSSAANTIGRELLAMAQGKSYDRMTITSERPRAELLEKLAGVYRFGPDFYRPNSTVTISIQNGHLFNGSDWLMPMTNSETTFRHRRYWSTLEFRMAGSGRAEELRYDGFVGRRSSGLVAWRGVGLWAAFLGVLAVGAGAWRRRLRPVRP